MYILYIVYIMYVGIHKYRYIHIYVCFLYICIYAFHKKGKNRACGTIQLHSIVLVMATNNKNNKNSLSNKVKVKGTSTYTHHMHSIYTYLYIVYVSIRSNLLDIARRAHPAALPGRRVAVQ